MVGRRRHLAPRLLRSPPPGGDRRIELAYTLAPEWWRRGLATESARERLRVIEGLG
jgi:RimJ/RimL family protein N-acetyltransferase